MTPRPTSDSVLTKVPTPLVGEWALRLKVSQNAVRPDYVITKGMTYRDLSIDRAMKPEVDLYGDYVLTRVTGSEGGYNDYWFGKPKTDEEANTPFKTEPNNEHFEWPQVIKSWVRAQDSTLTVTRARANGTTYKVPKEFALIVGYPQTFRSCRTLTEYFLNNKPFNIPEHAYPDPSPLEWILNGAPDSINGLHPEMLLPRGTGSINTTEIQGDTTTFNPSLGTQRHFPATLMKDWTSFILRDKQDETETGQYLRIRTRIFPPKRPPLQSL